MSRYAVVGCRECHEHWIVEELRQKETSSCPRCGTTRQTDKLRAKEWEDEWEVAAERRARILADRAGELDRFLEEDDYPVLQDEIDLSPPTSPLDENPYTELYADQAEAHLEQRENLLQEEAEAYLDRRFATGEEDDDPPDRDLDVFDEATGEISVTVAQTDVRSQVRITADSSPADLWKQLATSNSFQDQLTRAVRELLAEDSGHDHVGTLLDAGVTAADGGLARLFSFLDLPAEHEDHQAALDVLAGIGQDGMTMLGHLPIETVLQGPLALLDAAGITPRLTVVLDHRFKQRRRDQREDILWLLGALGKVANVRVATTGLTARWLHAEHRRDLPTEFRNSLSAHCHERADPDERVEAALDELDPDGRAVALLRELRNEPGGTLLRSELPPSLDVTSGRVTQLLDTLEDLSLVERYGKRNQKFVELLPAGSAFMDRLTADYARQTELDSEFSHLFQDENDSRVTPRTRGGTAEGGSADRHRLAHYHEATWTDRPEQAAVAAAPPEGGGIGLLNHPIGEMGDRGGQRVSFDAGRDEAQVGAEYDNPMQWAVSVAMGLTSGKLVRKTQLRDRLGDEDLDFKELLDSGRHILRGGRQLGWLSDDVQDADEYVDTLQEAANDLGALTKKLKNGEYDNESRFRGEILRDAHGLAGTMVSIFDLVDIEVTRYARIPRFKQFDQGDLDDLAEVLANHSVKTSRIGHFSAFRALYETRDRKRQTAIMPAVDAEDPYGQLMGDIALIGPDVEDFEDQLAEELEEPRDIVEDAPEFAVPVPISTTSSSKYEVARNPSREAYSVAISRILQTKNISPTRDAVSLLMALTGSPLDAAQALQELGKEDHIRDIRLDEVRFALTKLDAERLLPETKPSVSKILSALLESDRPLSKTELAEAADVSRTSVHRHLGSLVSLGLALQEDGGVRLALPTSDERESGPVPAPITGQSRAMDLLFELVLHRVEDPERLGDSGDPLGDAFTWPPDLQQLQEELLWVEPWIPVARALTSETDQETGPRTVQFGATIEQQPLPLDDVGPEEAPAD